MNEDATIKAALADVILFKNDCEKGEGIEIPLPGKMRLTVLIDPASGRIVHSTGLFERERFVVDVTPRPGGSFYTRYGELPLVLLIGAGMLFLLVVGRVGDRPRGR